MRTLVLAFCLLFAAPALAGPIAVSAEAKAEATLDDLFLRLKKAQIPEQAERVADDIQHRWRQSGSATVDLMMGWAGDAAEAKKFDVALDFLDQVTILAPAYAEGWNRRATVHFLAEDFSKSMADIEKTLALEPRHFGALSGMAVILRSAGREELALKAYERVLALYPANREAQAAVSELSEKLTGDRI
ncbi:MAG: hypothetical protein IPL47_04505 [Phyllobacteriaceae bacterium]|nr:hypothetical protein [Phyllobacteriaceae bacterium]